MNRQKNHYLPIMFMCVYMAATYFIAPVNANSSLPKNSLQADQQWFQETQIGELLQEPLASVWQKTFPDKEWWKRFEDPLLVQLIELTLKNNFRLRIAEERIKDARLLAIESLGTEFPKVDLGATASRSKFSKNLTVPSLDQLSGNNNETGTIFAPGKSVNFFNLPLTMSYELDFLTKKRDLTKAQNKNVEYTEWDAKIILIQLLSEMVNTYYNYTVLSNAVFLQENIISSGQDMVKLAKARYKAKLGSWDDVQNAEIDLLEKKKVLSDLVKDKSIALNGLSLLSGESVSHLASLLINNIEAREENDFNIIYKKLNMVQVGVPSELIAHRPDIMAQEALLAKANLEVKAARKALFPSIILSFQTGLNSIQLKDLFSWDSLSRTLSASFTQSLFSGGSKKAAYKRIKSNAMQQFYQYHLTVKNAFYEVENVLSELNQDNVSIEKQNLQLTYSKDVLNVLEKRYEKGFIPYDTVLKQIIATKETEKELLKIYQKNISDQVSLYKALGGGF